MTATPPLSRRLPFGCRGLLSALLALGLAVGPSSVRAQAPLHLVNDRTSVREISFRFVDGQTFAPERLKAQIATTAPGFFARLQNRFAFLPGLQRRPFPFDPVTLQKDVVRLRRFYQQNGFPSPRVDYPASQLDTAANTIHVIFTVQEGAPVTIQNLSFRSADGARPVTALLDASLRQEWAAFRDRASVQPGERYTEFKRTQTEGDIQTWLRNQGYAFARVDSEARIDTAATAASLRFRIDPGPLTRVSDIVVEGNETVSKRVVLRELPFQVGDRFSAADVSAGQQQLFDLNLFRVALADVPEQPRDSTVRVRYRVRESNLRSYSGQLGYGTQPGVTLEGSWRHRNFQGDARTLIVGLLADTGYPQNPPDFFPSFLSQSAAQDPSRRFEATVTLRQPYLLTDRLSASLEPFALERLNPTLGADSTRFLGLNERQFGFNTQLIYDFLPFRSLSLQYSLARIQQFRASAGPDTPGVGDDLFDKSVFSLSATLGEADDFLNPTRGYIFRPSLEVGGYPFDSGVDFVRLSGGLSGYLPVSSRVKLAGRVFGGVLWPFDESRANLTLPPSASNALKRENRKFQDRFSEYLFYAGGGSDVRGWRSQLAGGKVLRESDIARVNFVYRPIGARLKLGANLEARLPFPGLGASWRTALFVDAAYLDSGALSLIPPPSVSGTLRDPGDQPTNPDDRSTSPEDQSISTDPSQLLVGTGGGVRYQTPFGFVRLDLAYKLTPDALDLRRPNAVGREAKSESQNPIDAAPIRPIRRFRLHFGIGRSF
ncbi:MAG: outer membrane protein assembly factor [Salinibacter sp.]